MYWKNRDFLDLNVSIFLTFLPRKKEAVAVGPDQKGQCSTVGNTSDCRCVSDCGSRGREFDPGPVPYFQGDRSSNNFYGYYPGERTKSHWDKSPLLCNKMLNNIYGNDLPDKLIKRNNSGTANS